MNSSGISVLGNKQLFPSQPTQVTAADTVVSTASKTAFATQPTLYPDIRVGDVFIIEASGIYSCTGTPNLTYDCDIGSTSLPTITMGNMASGATDAYWTARWVITVTAVGASGTIEVNATASYPASLGSVRTTIVGATGTTLNTAIANLIKVYVTWSASSGSNTTTLKQLVVTRQPAP